MNRLLKILRLIFSILTVVFAGYSLITGNHEVMPYMMLFMGAMFLVMGIDEILESRKTLGIISLIVAVFIFYVAVEGFLLQ